MLLKQTKRQSFSIDSLAVSSHVEQERNTDSPYLSYLEESTSSAARNSRNVDFNSNVSMNWAQIHGYYSDRDFRPLIIDENRAVQTGEQTTIFKDIAGASLVDYSTSTPKMPSPKRRRVDSTSTPPSSSDDSAAEDKMVVDDSSVLSGEYLVIEKTSPASTTNSSVASDVDNESTCSDSSQRRKKARTAFTGEQLRELEKRYKTQKYLTASDRTNIAKSLKLKEQQVKTWFQNRRMKEKRQQREDEQSRAFCLPTGGVDVSQLAALGICPPPFHLGQVSPSAISQTNNSAHRSPVDPSVARDVASQNNRLPSPIGSSYHGNSAFTARHPALQMSATPFPSHHATAGLEHAHYSQAMRLGEVLRTPTQGATQTQPINYSLASPRPLYPTPQYLGQRL